MIRSFLLGLALACALPTTAQSWEWATGFPGPGLFEFSFGIAVDSAGDAFVCGYFDDELPFGNDTLLPGTNLTTTSFFLGKLSSAGQPLWAVSSPIGGSGAYDCALDDAGNIYSAGFFQDTMFIGNDTLVEGQGSSHSFVARWASDGTANWSASVSSVPGGFVSVDDITIAQNRIFLCGRYRRNVVYKTLTIGNNTSDFGLFVLELDTAGNPIMGTILAEGSGQSRLYDIEVDQLGNIYLAGEGPGQIVVGTDTIPAPTNGNSSSRFVIQLDAQGNYQWLQTIGTSFSQWVYSIDMATDPQNNMVVYFQMSDTIDLNGDSLIPTDFSDMGLIKFAPSGQVLWSKLIAGSASSNEFGVTTDASANIYLSSESNFPLDFGDTIFPIPAFPVGRTFVAKVGPDGTSQWCLTGGASAGRNGVIAMGPQNAIYTAGSTTFPSVFGNDSLTWTSGSGSDIYVAKVAPDSCPVIQPAITQSLVCFDTAVLTGPAGYSEYSWATSNSSTILGTTASITVIQPGDYYLVVTDSAGCSGSSDYETVVFTGDTLSITAGGPLDFCAGDSVALTADSGYSSYSWSTGESGSSIAVAQSDTVWVTAFAGTCTATDTVITTAYTLPQPVLAQGDTSFCAGDSVVMGTTNSFPNYAWSNGATATITPVSVSDSIWVMVTDANGCSGTSDTTQVTVWANPTPLLSQGDTAFCAGDSVGVTTALPYAAYAWNNGSSMANQSVAASASLLVTVTDSNGCSGVSNTTAITVNALPQPQLNTGDTAVCAGEALPVYPLSGYAQLLWMDGSGVDTLLVTQADSIWLTVTDSNGCVGGTDTVVALVNALPVPLLNQGDTAFCAGDSVQVGLQQAYSGYAWQDGVTDTTRWVAVSQVLSVTVTDANGCSGGSDTTAITVQALPQPQLNTGDTAVCAGDTVTMALLSGYPQVLWMNGTTANSLAVDQSLAVSVLVTDTNGCVGGSDTAYVTVDPLPLPQLNVGDTAVCDGETLAVYPLFGYAQLLWMNGSTADTLDVSQAAAVSVQVTDSNGCSNGSDTVTVQINALPPVGLLSNGPLTFCDGDSATLFPLIYYPGIFWNGQPDSTFTATTSGLVVLDVIDSNGCSASDSATVVVYPNPLANAGPDTAVCSGSPLTLQGSGGVTYQWTPGFSLNDSTLANPIATLVNSTRYRLTVTDSNGCQGRDSVLISINPLPFVVVVSPVPGVCDVDTVLSLSSQPMGGTFSGPGVTNGDFESAVAGVGVHTITYAFTDSNGCTNTDSTQIEVWANPPVPVLSRTGDSISAALGAPGPFTLSWWLDGQPLSGPTDSNLVPQTNGAYLLAVEDQNGCQSVSDPFNYVWVSVAKPGTLPHLTVYPNPNRDGVFQVTGLENRGLREVTITDAAGRLVWQQAGFVPGLTGPLEFRLPQPEAGVYFIRFRLADGTETARLVVQ